MSLISDFLAEQGFSPTTNLTYTVILSRFLAEYPDSASVTASDLLSFVHKPEWGNSRQCVALAACKSFIRWAHDKNHAALRVKIKRVVGKPQRSLSPETALILLASFNPHTAKGARDLAICALALDTGLRCSELCRLRQADTDTEKCVLQVIVKGGQWKAAVFSQQTAAHIEHWKAFRQNLKPQGCLFVTTRKHQGRGLTPEGLNTIVSEWGRHIGIKLSPHDLRRSFATMATMNGAPERVLMEGGRWSNSAMIQRYTRTLKLEAMRQYLPMSKLG